MQNERYNKGNALNHLVFMTKHHENHKTNDKTSVVNLNKY